jgi:protoheme IX farnesyltransferase
MQAANLPVARFSHAAQQYWVLTKPRVVALIVFCAVIGMFLGVDGWPPMQPLIAATAGIWLVAGAAAAVNCLVERRIDALMARTRARPLPRGELNNLQTLVFSGMIGCLGVWLLYVFVNPLTMWLTLATFVGYAIIYTIVLKPNTPQNIVIGGASGAMPPVLGWAAMTNSVTAESLVLFLIIFIWTPPHFWALALYRTQEYAKAGLPMLPVTHGPEFTRFHVFLYTVMLTGTTVLPFAIKMSGWIYLASALVLDAVFLYYAWRVWKHYTEAISRRTFAYSILYLALLFAALLLDHYLG